MTEQRDAATRSRKNGTTDGTQRSDRTSYLIDLTGFSVSRMHAMQPLPAELWPHMERGTYLRTKSSENERASPQAAPCAR